MRLKINAKYKNYIFFGYCEGIKAYKLMYLETKKIIKNHDVKFLEYKTACKYLELYQSESNDIFMDTSPILAKKKEENENNEDDKGVSEDEDPKKVDQSVFTIT